MRCMSDGACTCDVKFILHFGEFFLGLCEFLCRGAALLFMLAHFLLGVFVRLERETCATRKAPATPLLFPSVFRLFASPFQRPVRFLLSRPLVAPRPSSAAAPIPCTSSAATRLRFRLSSRVLAIFRAGGILQRGCGRVQRCFFRDLRIWSVLLQA